MNHWLFLGNLVTHLPLIYPVPPPSCCLAFGVSCVTFPPSLANVPMIRATTKIQALKYCILHNSIGRENLIPYLIPFPFFRFVSRVVLFLLLDLNFWSTLQFPSSGQIWVHYQATWYRESLGLKLKYLITLSRPHPFWHFLLVIYCPIAINNIHFDPLLFTIMSSHYSGDPLQTSRSTFRWP